MDQNVVGSIKVSKLFFSVSNVQVLVSVIYLSP